MLDEFSTPRERREAYPTMLEYCRSRDDEGLARLIWDTTHQHNVFASYPGNVGEHSLAIIAAASMRTPPVEHVELTDTLVCDICAKPLNPDDICATDIELGICHAECLEGSPVVNLDTGEPLPDSKLHTYRFGDTEKVERRITHLEAALAAEEERSKQLLVRLDKAREGKEPDFCYDPDEWEYTCDWEERDQVHGHGDALSVAEPMQVATLIRGPRKWVAKVPTSWDENGDPDDTEIKWFDSEEAARAALAAPASEGSTGE